MKWINALSIPIRILIISVVVLALAYLIFLSPSLKRHRLLQRKIQKVERELRQGEKLVKTIKLPDETEKSKWKAVQARLDSLPAAINLPALTGMLAKLAKTHNIPDASFSNARSAPSFQLIESGARSADFVIRLSFDCPYRNLADFLKGMDLMNAGAVVESLEAKKAHPVVHTELSIRPIWVNK